MISIIIPIFNGEKYVRESVTHLKKFFLGKKYEILIINDGSLDNSFAVAKELEDKQVRVYGYKKNKGRGFALKYAARFVRGKEVIMIDVDLPLQINLTILNQMLWKLDEFDIVIASRFLKNSNIKRKMHRSFASSIYRCAVHIVFPKLNIKDPDVGLKAFRRETFKKIAEKVVENRWCWDLEFLIRAQKEDYRSYEIPLTWNEGEDSTVRLFRDALDQGKGLFSIKAREVLRN